jgi:hypothetical protein
MERNEASIKRLSRLTSGLAKQLVRKFGPDGLKPDGFVDLWSIELEGRSFARWVQELWPDQLRADAPMLCQTSIEELITQREQALAQARQDLDDQEEKLAESESRLGDEDDSSDSAMEEARLHLARSETKLGQLKMRQASFQQAADRQRSQMDSLGYWLEGIAPKGLKYFSDAAGRQVSKDDIKASAQKLESLTQAEAENRVEAAELNRDIESVRNQCLQIRQNLADLQKASDKAKKILDQQRGDLMRQRQALAEKRQALSGLEEAVTRAQNLARLHDEILDAAGISLSPLLIAPEPEPADAPVEAVRASVTRANLAAERIKRLERLLRKQAGSLERIISRAGESLAQARKINQEIEDLETELPKLLSGIVHPGEDLMDQRSKSAARITTLIARLDELSPQAIDAHNELLSFSALIKAGMRRAGKLQRAWRQAGATESGHHARARELIESVRLAAELRKNQSQQMAEKIAPIMAALSPLRSLELEPQLAQLTSQIARLRFESLELKILSVELDDGLCGPSVGARDKSPISLSPFASALKRMAAQQVRVEQIYSLSVAAQRWFDMAAGPLVNDIRRPAEELARQLSDQVEELTSQKTGLEEIRQRHEAQLGLLRVKLQDEQRVSQDIMDRLDQAHEMLSQQNGILSRYKADVRRSTQESQQVKQELEQERGTSQKLNRLLQETTDSLTRRLNETTKDLTGKLENTTREYEEKLDRTFWEWDHHLTSTTEYYENELETTRSELTRSLAETTLAADSLADHLERSQKLARALKSKSLERHRLYRKSRHALEWMDYWKERALEQEALLGRTRAELDQARSEYEQARGSMTEIAKHRDQAETELAQEREARARQALDLLGGKALSVELAASQGEAGRWAALAGQLAVALAASGKAHENHSQELQAQVNQLSSEAAKLKQQLAATAHLMQAAEETVPNSVRPATVTVRVSSMEPEQIYSALDRLGKSRQRLQRIGRSTLGHMAIVAALTGGLVLVPPSTPTTATRTDAP